MPKGGGVREAVSDVARHASAVARLQAELSRAELRSAGLLGFGAAACAVMAFLLLTVLIVAALAIPLPLWLAVLIVMLLYAALAGVLGAALRRSRQAGVAKEQLRITTAALRSARSGGQPAPAEQASSPAAFTAPATPRPATGNTLPASVGGPETAPSSPVPGTGSGGSAVEPATAKPNG